MRGGAQATGAAIRHCENARRRAACRPDGRVLVFLPIRQHLGVGGVVGRTATPVQSNARAPKPRHRTYRTPHCRLAPGVRHTDGTNAGVRSAYSVHS